MGEYVLGPVTQFEKFPAEVEINRDPYYLIKTNEGAYKLLLRYCPHAGVLVEAEEKGFFCYGHGWSFDEWGKCLNSWSDLESREVEERDGQLIAKL